ncbi:MAG: DNA adenine methylase [Deltaproteobacteria bacterium]|nr:DNA adenine methylase [Deltaproteobacteria bacterium]
MLRQPIPYQGSKRRLAPQIASHFPSSVGVLYEPFAGSAALTLYAARHGLADRFVLGDALVELAELWAEILRAPDRVAHAYARRWAEPDGFLSVRDRFNRTRDPFDLHYLLVRCVKNAVRFSARGDFSQSADRRRVGVHPDRLREAVHQAHQLLVGRCEVRAGDWRSTIHDATGDDLVFLDPPYLGTSIGADRRYAAQLGLEDLLGGLRHLQERQVATLLSYDGRTGAGPVAEALPASLGGVRLWLDAGRSAQATLLGRNEQTLESLYDFTTWRAGLPP